MVLCACQYGGEEEDGDNDNGHSHDTVEFVVPHPKANIGDRVHCEATTRIIVARDPPPKINCKRRKC